MGRKLLVKVKEVASQRAVKKVHLTQRKHQDQINQLSVKALLMVNWWRFQIKSLIQPTRKQWEPLSDGA